jgi:hypothetical protein
LCVKNKKRNCQDHTQRGTQKQQQIVLDESRNHNTNITRNNSTVFIYLTTYILYLLFSL